MFNKRKTETPNSEPGQNKRSKKHILQIKEGVEFDEVREKLINSYFEIYSKTLEKEIVDVIIIKCETTSSLSNVTLIIGLMGALKNRDRLIYLAISSALPESIRQEFLENINYYNVNQKNVLIVKDMATETLKDLALNVIARNKDLLEQSSSKLPIELQEELALRKNQLAWENIDEERIRIIEEELIPDKVVTLNGKCYKNYFTDIVHDKIEKIILSYDPYLELEDTSLPYGLINALQTRTKPIELVVSAELSEEKQQNIMNYLGLYSGYLPHIAEYVLITKESKEEIEEIEERRILSP